MLKKYSKLFVLIFVVLAMTLMLCACNNDESVTMRYDNASAYNVADSGELTYGADNIGIEIDWICGDIIFTSSETAQQVSFYEVATGETPTSDTTMHYLYELNILHIKYAKSGTSKTGNLRKNLYVTVPTNLRVGEIEIESVSGNISIGCNAVSVDVEQVSGSVDISGEVWQVDVESVSGNVTVQGDRSLMELDVETVSGNVTLKMNENWGFTLEYETISGQLINAFESQTGRQGNYYIYQGGERNIDVETVSGSLVIEALQ